MTDYDTTDYEFHLFCQSRYSRHATLHVIDTWAIKSYLIKILHLQFITHVSDLDNRNACL